MRRNITHAGRRKRLSAALLLMTAALVFALSSCGSSSGEDQAETATQSDAEGDTETSAEEETSEDTGDQAEDSAGEDAADENGTDAEAAGTEQEETEAETTTTEPETTTRSEAEVGARTLADGTVVIDGYEVSLYLPLPEAWEEYDLDGETIYVSEDYPLSVPNISVYASENDGSLNYTTKEIIEEVCEETFADMSFTMGEFENTTISGCDAVIYSYSIVTGETEITQYYVLIETELTLFRITFTDSGDAYAADYEECISGITLS
ncbi:MAG: hypothetical protein LUE29_02450 [Lachnospiraceae bacterium]|nr:hypothetical protein [Lachnospiraceae bacterium]